MFKYCYWNDVKKSLEKMQFNWNIELDFHFVFCTVNSDFAIND